MISIREQIYFCNFVPANPTMNTLRKTGLTLRAALVLLSTTGFNVWHHICGCRFAPEELHPHACCQADVPLPVSKEDPCGDGFGECHAGCRNVPVYFKASIIAVPLAQKLSLLQADQVLVADVPFLPTFNAESDQHGFFCKPEKPPLIGGKHLILFLHQLRIPFSA